jgi:hypothetical protein
MKTAEHAFNEYCRLQPVQCFCGKEHNWEQFKTCCLRISKKHSEVSRCKSLIVQKILSPKEGKILKAILFLFPNGMGSALFDQSCELAEKLFDLLSKKWLPQFLIACETEEEVLKKFPSFKIPTVEESDKRIIQNLYTKYASFVFTSAQVHSDDGGFDFHVSDLKSIVFPLSFSVKRLWMSQYLKCMLERDDIFLSTLVFNDEYGVVIKVGTGRYYNYYSFPKLTSFKQLRPNQVEHLFPEKKTSGT